jgi:hypothetical protein
MAQDLEAILPVLTRAFNKVELRPRPIAACGWYPSSPQSDFGIPRGNLVTLMLGVRVRVSLNISREGNGELSVE